MKFLAALVIGLVALSSPVALAQTDHFLGTWVLNVGKSTYTPGPAPKSQVSVYGTTGGGVKVTTKAVSASGPATTTEFTTNFDGKDATVTGNPDYDASALKRIDSHTVEFTRKRGGKVVQTGTMVVSKDGKTRTVTTDGVNAKGEKIHNVAVYDRQGGGTSR